jgi:hypothetical protein
LGWSVGEAKGDDVADAGERQGEGIAPERLAYLKDRGGRGVSWAIT